MENEKERFVTEEDIIQWEIKRSDVIKNDERYESDDSIIKNFGDSFSARRKVFEEIRRENPNFVESVLAKDSVIFGHEKESEEEHDHFVRMVGEHHGRFYSALCDRMDRTFREGAKKRAQRSKEMTIINSVINRYSIDPCFTERESWRRAAQDMDATLLEEEVDWGAIDLTEPQD